MDHPCCGRAAVLARGLAVAVAVAAVAVTGCGVGSSRAAAGRAEAEAPDAAERSDLQVSSSGVVLDVEGETAVTRPVVEIPDRWNSPVEAVYGRYWLYWDAFAAAHALPSADPDHEQLQALSTPDNWRELQQQLREFDEAGMVLVLPERSITEHMVRIPNASVLEETEGTEVILQDCWIDDFVQQTVDGRVVAEAKEAKLMNVLMKVVDGQWRVDGVTRATAESDGFEQCETLVSESQS